jgi:hypothetical protein
MAGTVKFEARIKELGLIAVPGFPPGVPLSSNSRNAAGNACRATARRKEKSVIFT